MRKLIIFLLGVFMIFIFWCGWKSDNLQEELWKKSGKDFIADEVYVISGNWNSSFTFNGKIVPENIKTIVSNNWGVLKYLDCQEWEMVSRNRLIAKVFPDYSSPATKNLEIQKQSLISQKKNINSIISSTKENYDLQIKNLKNQKLNNERQLEVLKENVEILKNQKGSTSWDIKIQISTLEENIASLQRNLEITKENRKKEIAKLKENITNLRRDIRTNVKDTLLKIDEIFWVTDENDHKNDSYEAYLGAKNTSLKNNVENKFEQLNKKKGNMASLSDSELSSFLWEVINLTDMARECIDDSIISKELPQSMLKWEWGFYTILLTYSQNLSSMKTNFDSMYMNLDTVKNKYESQINELENNLSTYKNNLLNLKENKKSSSLNNLDTQINSLASNIIKLKNAVDDFDSRIKTTQKNKESKITELENQKINIQQNIDSINTQLSPEIIRAEVKGKVNEKFKSQWDTIKANKSICQIIPDSKNNFKVKIFSPKRLTLWSSVKIYINDNIVLDQKIQRELPSKDPVTQNYIYETSLDLEKNIDLKSQQDVKVEIEKKDLSSSKSQNKEILIPLDYVIPQLNWNFVYKVVNSESIEDKKNYAKLDYQKIKVELGQIDWWYIKILSWLTISDVVAR